MKNYRWWDVALISITELPKDFTATNTNLIAKGNNWHDHTFKGWVVYITKDEKNLWDDFVFWYLEAKDTILYHEEHWIDVWNKLREVKIEDWIYELRGQKEYTAEWMVAVID